MKKLAKNIPSPYEFEGTPIFRDTTDLPFLNGGPLVDKTNHGKLLNSIYASALGDYYANGGMLKRADGSYSPRGLWDNIRDNAGSGKKPTKQMLAQEKKINREYKEGGQFPTPYSLPEDSFMQGGNNLHNSVYASSPGQYPAPYNFGGTLHNNLATRQQMYMPLDHITREGGSILSMSNTPQLEGEGKDLAYQNGGHMYPDGGQFFTYSGRPGATYQKVNGQWYIQTNGTNGQFIPVQDPTGRRTALLNSKATPIAMTTNKYQRTYDPLLDVKPQVGETTQKVAQDFMMAKDSKQYAEKSMEAQARAQAEKSPEQIANETTTSSLKNSLTPEEKALAKKYFNSPDYNYYHDPIRGVREGNVTEAQSFMERMDELAWPAFQPFTGNPSFEKTKLQEFEKNKVKKFQTLDDAMRAVYAERIANNRGQSDTRLTPSEEVQRNQAIQQYQTPPGQMASGRAAPVDWFWTAPIAGPAALEMLGGLGAMSVPGMSAVPGATIGNLVNSGFIANSLMQAPSNVKSWYDVSQGKKNWQDAAAESAEIAAGMIGSGAGVKSLAQDAKGLLKAKAVGTEEIIPKFDNLVDIESYLQGLPRLGRPANPENLEEIRKAYHTGDRILTSGELDLLEAYGRGNTADYTTGYSAEEINNLLGSRLAPPNFSGNTSIEQLRNMGINDTPSFTRRGITDFSDPARNAERLNNIISQRGVNLTPFNSEGITSLDDLETALESWFQNNRLDSELLADDMVARVNNVRSKYGLGSSDEVPLHQAIQELSAEQKSKLIGDLSAKVTSFTPDELVAMRSNFQTRNLKTANPKSKLNQSGLSKEDAAKKASKEGKESLEKMSEEEFANTVLTPAGELLPYNPKKAEGIIDMPAQEYAETFNKNLGRLNEIIAEKNKSGVPYQVEKLDPSGRLVFKTPERTVTRDLSDADKSILLQAEADLNNAIGEYDYMSKNNMFADQNEASLYLQGINQQKAYNQNLQNRLTTEVIPEGTSSWGVGIKPGQWAGEVENTPSEEYFKSIPGLSITNSVRGVFADNVARRGSGTYEALNDYLKELNLGRVKPGFNSQTKYSKGLWENAVNKGKAVGYYGDPNVVYGSMKSMLPYIGVGGAVGGAALLGNPWQQNQQD